MKSRIKKAALAGTARRAGKLTGKALKTGVSAINPGECLREIIKARADYLKVVEQEHTKRLEIRAGERKQLARIERQTKLLMEYLTLSFDERRENFALLLASLARASEAGDTATAAGILDAIVQLGKSSPFEALATIHKVRATLGDPDKQFEF